MTTPANNADPLSSSACSDTPRPNALVVDDSKAARLVLRDLLETGGWNVAELPSLAPMIETVRATSPGAVLLANRMPDGDSFETLRKLRATLGSAASPVIVMMPRDTSSDIPQAFAAGAVDCVYKPFLAVELLARLNAARARHEEAQRARQQVAEHEALVRKLVAELVRHRELTAAAQRELVARVSAEFRVPLERVVEFAQHLQGWSPADVQPVLEVFRSFLSATQRVASSARGIQPEVPATKTTQHTRRVDQPHPPGTPETAAKRSEVNSPARLAQG